MKKALALLVMGALSVSVLAGCGGSKQAAPAEAAPAAEEAAPAEEEAPAAEEAVEEALSDAVEEAAAPAADVFVGISAPKASTGWTAAVSYYAEKYCVDNGINYKLVQAESTNDQANQIDDLIAQSPDVIVLLPINDELATAAQTVMDAGIPLVNFDRTLGATTPDYYLAGNNPACGSNGADWMAETLGADSEAKIAVISVTSWGNIAEERRVGFEEELAEVMPNATVIGEYASESASQEDGLKVMADVLQANPELDAVFCVDDEQACGILQAINEAERTDIQALYAAGGGATNFLNKIEGSAFPIATCSYYPSMMAEAVEIGIQVAAGEEGIETTIIKDSPVIDVNTMADWKASVGYDPDSPY